MFKSMYVSHLVTGIQKSGYIHYYTSIILMYIDPCQPESINTHKNDELNTAQWHKQILELNDFK